MGVNNNQPNYSNADVLKLLGKDPKSGLVSKQDLIDAKDKGGWSKEQKSLMDQDIKNFDKMDGINTNGKTDGLLSEADKKTSHDLAQKDAMKTVSGGGGGQNVNFQS